MSYQKGDEFLAQARAELRRLAGSLNGHFGEVSHERVMIGRNKLPSGEVSHHLIYQVIGDIDMEMRVGSRGPILAKDEFVDTPNPPMDSTLCMGGVDVTSASHSHD